MTMIAAVLRQTSADEEWQGEYEVVYHSHAAPNLLRRELSD
jgi:hypothetical protein